MDLINAKNEEGAVIFLDQEKAFNMVSFTAINQISTSLAQWFNKYHAGLEVMGSIPMGDFHI